MVIISIIVCTEVVASSSLPILYEYNHCCCYYSSSFSIYRYKQTDQQKHKDTIHYDSTRVCTCGFFFSASYRLIFIKYPFYLLFYSWFGAASFFKLSSLVLKYHQNQQNIPHHHRNRQNIPRHYQNKQNIV